MSAQNSTQNAASLLQTLYVDDYCELTDRALLIKRYFFPSLATKIVRVDDIRLVYFEAQQHAKYARRRLWGMDARTHVHWAADFARCLPGEKRGKHDVVLDVEDGVKKGFTVCDPEDFFNALRSVAPISLIIVDNLNY